MSKPLKDMKNNEIGFLSIRDVAQIYKNDEYYFIINMGATISAYETRTKQVEIIKINNEFIVDLSNVFIGNLQKKPIHWKNILKIRLENLFSASKEERINRIRKLIKEAAKKERYEQAAKLKELMEKELNKKGP